METDNKPHLHKSHSTRSVQIEVEEIGFKLSRAKSSTLDLAQYREVAEIYKNPLAPSVLSIGTLPNSHQKVVIKEIFKECLVNDFMRAQAALEFPLQCSLKHENIVKGYEWAETEKEYILIMEMMNHADYFENKIDRDLCFVKCENKIKSYMNDSLEGLSYLHRRGIIHGDIKLQNLLVHETEGEDSFRIVKLCDFGLSRIMKQGKSLMEFPVGTKHHMAPEIKPKAYVNEKIDLWALGVVLYKMSVAYLPTQITGYKYGSGPIPFRKVDWRKRSPQLQDLIGRLLEVNPEKRISAEEALQHEWFQIE